MPRPRHAGNHPEDRDVPLTFEREGNDETDDRCVDLREECQRRIPVVGSVHLLLEQLEGDRAEPPVIRERRLLHLVKWSLVPAGLERPDRHAFRGRAGVLVGGERLAHRVGRPHLGVAARRQQRLPCDVTVDRLGADAFRTALRREGLTPRQGPGPDPPPKMIRMCSHEGVERTAFLGAPDALREAGELRVMHDEPGVTLEVRRGHVPDPGEVFPDRIGIEPKGPVGVVHEADDAVEVGVGRGSHGVLRRKGVEVGHRQRRA